MRDNKNRINDNIAMILQELEDEKGTAVRECLKYLPIILLYKYELADIIKEKLEALDISKYKESMQSLISKDVAYILKNL